MRGKYPGKVHPWEPHERKKYRLKQGGMIGCYYQFFFPDREPVEMD
jgi:hypothetical protein